jgi:hypothetical protein
LQSELSTTGALSFAGSVKAKDGSYAALIDTAGSSAHWQVLKKAPALRLGDVVFDVSGEEKDCGANGNDVSIYVGSMSVENDAHDITSGDVTVKKRCDGGYDITGFSEAVEITNGGHVRNFNWQAYSSGNDWTFKMTSGEMKLDDDMVDTLTLDPWQSSGTVKGTGGSMLAAVKASKMKATAALDWADWVVDHDTNSFIIKLSGDIDGPVPCNAGDQYTGKLKLKFTATDLKVPRNYAQFVYHCGAKTGQLSWTLDVSSETGKMGSKSGSTGDVYAITDLRMYIDSYLGVPDASNIVGPRDGTAASGVAWGQFKVGGCTP